jgi:hypothetical protein
VAIQARKSEYVDQNSGVSARLPIALIKNRCRTPSAAGSRSRAHGVDPGVRPAERGLGGERQGRAGAEGEQRGLNVARAPGRGIKALFAQRPDAYKPRRTRARRVPRRGGRRRGGAGFVGIPPDLESGSGERQPRPISDDMPQAEYVKALPAVKSLERLAATPGAETPEEGGGDGAGPAAPEPDPLARTLTAP